MDADESDNMRTNSMNFFEDHLVKIVIARPYEPSWIIKFVYYDYNYDYYCCYCTHHQCCYLGLGKERTSYEMTESKNIMYSWVRERCERTLWRYNAIKNTRRDERIIISIDCCSKIFPRFSD